MELCETGDTEEECLRKLEQAAELPEGDLYLHGEKHRVGFRLKGIQQIIRSKEGAKWSTEGTGSVHGYVIFFGEHDYSIGEMCRMPGIVLQIVTRENYYAGMLYVRRGPPEVVEHRIRIGPGFIKG